MEQATTRDPDRRRVVRGRPATCEEFRLENGLSTNFPVPIDAVTRSGSGLDPHISVANATLQIARVARERKLSQELVRQLVQEHTFGPQLGFLGSARVSVLELNLALDGLAALPPHRRAPDHLDRSSAHMRWYNIPHFS